MFQLDLVSTFTCLPWVLAISPFQEALVSFRRAGDKKKVAALKVVRIAQQSLGAPRAACKPCDYVLHYVIYWNRPFQVSAVLNLQGIDFSVQFVFVFFVKQKESSCSTVSFAAVLDIEVVDANMAMERSFDAMMAVMFSNRVWQVADRYQIVRIVRWS